MRSSHQDITLDGHFFSKVGGQTCDLTRWGSILVFYCDFRDQFFYRAFAFFLNFSLWQQRRSEEFQIGGLEFLSSDGSFWGSLSCNGQHSYISTSSHQWLPHPQYYHCHLFLVFFSASICIRPLKILLRENMARYLTEYTLFQMKNLRRYCFQL